MEKTRPKQPKICSKWVDPKQHKKLQKPNEINCEDETVNLINNKGSNTSWGYFVQHVSDMKKSATIYK